MRNAGILTLVAVCAMAILSCEREVEMKPISKEQAELVTRWLLPMPKELRFDGLLPVSPAELRVVTGEDAGELVQCAAKELQAAFGAEPPEKNAFPIYIGARSSRKIRTVADVHDLDLVQNRDQAYAIVPVQGSRPGVLRGIALVGRTEAGAYYAAKTLQQILEGATALAPSKADFALPVVTVRDWPDLAERGEWGGSANQDIEWFAERKMNLVESPVALSIDKDGRGVAKIGDGLIPRAKQHAVNLVPIITHLEQLPGEVFSRFPQVRGVGDPAAWQKVGSVVPACFSQPKLQELLNDWVLCLARVPEVTDVCVWLSENDVQCACEKCRASNQFVLETQTVLRAWEAAKRVKPGLRLRILLTQGSYKSNDKVLATVPKEVGVSYYDGGRTYNSDREPMIYPLLETYAAGGRWLGCYPQVTASWRIVCPWSGPQFVRFRMTEFVNKKLSNLCAYATPSNRFYDFNVTAAAEWSWNAAGRDERAFSLAWATRRRLPQPERVADWAVTLGPVGWDVYGSRVPYLWVYGGIGGQLTNGLPALGNGIFKYLESEKKIEDNLAICDRAMAMAKEVGAPEIISETQTITGYMQMLKGLHQLSGVVAKKKALTDDEKRAAAEAMKLVDAGASAAVEGLKEWQRAVASDIAGGRVADTVRATERTATEAAGVLLKLGVPDPNLAFRTHVIGGWKTEDFANGAEVQKKWEVTPYLVGPGRYEVQFLYEKGWCGLGMHRVALASADPSAPDKLTEIAFDKHEGITGHQPKNDVYVLDLKDHDAKRKYFIVADVRGSDPRAPEDRKGCGGSVVMRKLKP